MTILTDSYSTQAQLKRWQLLPLSDTFSKILKQYSHPFIGGLRRICLVVFLDKTKMPHRCCTLKFDKLDIKWKGMRMFENDKVACHRIWPMQSKKASFAICQTLSTVNTSKVNADKTSWQSHRRSVRTPMGWKQILPEKIGELLKVTFSKPARQELQFSVPEFYVNSNFWVP